MECQMDGGGGGEMGSGLLICITAVFTVLLQEAAEWPWAVIATAVAVHAHTCTQV